MIGPHIPRLRTTLRDLYQDATVHHEMMAEATGEEIHFLARGEYEAGLTILDTLVDENGHFTDHEALLIVRASLDCYLHEIEGSFPLKERLLQSLIQQIDAVEKAAFREDAAA